MTTSAPARWRYRLRVAPAQAQQLQQIFDTNRFVWNHLCGRWNDLWKYECVRYDWLAASKELTDLRHTFDWLGEMPRVPQAQTLMDFYQAVDQFFRTGGRPLFKKKGAHSSLRQTSFTIKNDRLFISIGNREQIGLRVVWHRPLPSKPKMVTIKRDAAGRWWASFTVEIEVEDIGSTGETTGLDLGLTTYATTEFPDADVQNPRYGRRAAKALARSQRNMARKQKGSRNRERARHRFAVAHAHVAAQRTDFAHKEARKLARRFDVIGVEDLKVKNMMANRSLARSIGDAGWSQFIGQLEWQAKKCGHEVVRINPHNTTQTCSACGVKTKHRLGLGDRTFTCYEPCCGHTEDRDRNAARNLNPNRRGMTGEGVDGSKTRKPTGDLAARAPEFSGVQ